GLDLRAGLVQQLASRLRSGVYVGEHRLDHLEFGDRPAELAPFVRIAGGDVEGALGDANRLGGNTGTAPIERPHRDVEPFARRADPVRVGGADAVEAELGG